VHIRLIKNKTINSLVLPKKHKGQYWITQINDDGYEERVISVEGTEDKWLLKSNRNAVIEDKNNQKQKEIILEPLGFYNVFLKNSNEKVFNLYRANYGRPKTLSEINSARSG
jgi:S-DNA-T family DNA segregation ATPase FtsK/SpoIIIE